MISPDVPPTDGAVLEPVACWKDFSDFGEQMQWSEDQTGITWRALYERMIFLPKEHQLTVVCLICTVSRPCSCGGGRRPDRRCELAITLSSLSAVPQEVWLKVFSGTFGERLYLFARQPVSFV